ncbi:MAG: hypothetical protein HFI02_16630 [Lachnospiraceae bacterium]|nr:hypothetical protein [Lachnospiraceae bacterium]
MTVHIGRKISRSLCFLRNNEAGCFDIYNKQGERIGAFDYSDIKVRQDSATGKQFLISEHETMSYDAMVLDGELQDAGQASPVFWRNGE